MTSSFGLLNTAYTALTAARTGTEVVGQNIANAATDGYVRQRANTVSVAAVSTGMLRSGVQVGGGVAVLGVARLADPLLDGRVQTTSSTNGYWSVQAGAMSTLETSLHEPGATGISATLQGFWSSWQTVASNPGNASQAGALLQKAAQLTSAIGAGYRDVTSQWSQQRDQVASSVTTVNALAGQVAALNSQIRQTVAAGGNANELLDQRAKLTTQLADVSGATVRDLGDGQVDVVLGGNMLVSGSTTRAIQLAGTTELGGASSDPARLVWADTGAAVQLDGGRIAGGLAVLAGTGPLAQAADAYNSLATTIATQVNAIHSTGATTSGATGLDFFSIAAGVPAALGLAVVPTDVSGVAAGAVGAGALDGSIADRIARIGSQATGGPDAQWATFVVATGSAASTANTQSTLAGSALASATSAQSSQESVDMDQETTDLLTWQHAYQGAARVLTTIDDMLDTLINKTGLVGR
jgi:flagellar hook-associated protein 1